MNLLRIIICFLIYHCYMHYTVAQADNFTSSTLNYRLYTREHQILYTDCEIFGVYFQPTHATKILINGWMSNIEYRMVPLLTDSYLDNMDCNVIGKTASFAAGIYCMWFDVVLRQSCLKNMHVIIVS